MKCTLLQRIAFGFSIAAVLAALIVWLLYDRVVGRFRAVSDTPFIKDEQAHELMDRMCSEPPLIDRLSENAFDAFDDMRAGERPLSAKQLLWIQHEAVRLNILEEPATNEWSSRTLQERERIRGRDVPTPAVLQQRALRPPHRMHELDDKKPVEPEPSES